MSRKSADTPDICSLKTDFFFLNVPRCASETLMALLLRFTMFRSLNPIFRPHYPYHFHTEQLLTVKLLPPPKNQTYNVFVNHVNFHQNRRALETLLPSESRYIGIVRNPFLRFIHTLVHGKWFENQRGFFNRNLEEKVNITDIEILMRYSSKHSEIGTGNLTNFLLYYFGYHKPDYIDAEVDEFTRTTFQKFDLILLADHFEESLILLRRTMCWSTRDILYLGEVHKHNYTDKIMSISNSKNISEWFKENNAADIKFYEACVKRFWDRVSIEGSDFWAEVEAFKEILQHVKSFCGGNSTSKNLRINKSQWTKRFFISKHFCDLMRLGSSQIMDTVSYYAMERSHVL